MGDELGNDGDSTADSKTPARDTLLYQAFTGHHPAGAKRQTLTFDLI